ncbi:hypothetical protein BHM03_00030661 [Ensete ventricosum]|nr:hypothetical protein BHM03_00030661 [Ensete ventricosum]
MAGRGGLARGRGSSMDEAKRISCYVSIALWKKTMATLKEEVRSYRWIAKGYHRRRRGSRSRRRRQRGGQHRVDTEDDLVGADVLEEPSTENVLAAIRDGKEEEPSTEERGEACRKLDGIEKVLLLIGADATVWGTRKTSCRRTPWQRREEAADSGSGGSRRRRRVVADKR